MQQNHSLLLFSMACCLLFLSHLPFITADPDTQISTSRGPWTDEGLYSCQVRNFVNHDVLNVHESDGLIKTPLLSAILLGPFKIFGTTLSVARSSLLLISYGLFFFIIMKRNELIPWALFFMSTSLLQYHIFHFSHYALAEVLASLCCLLALITSTQYRTKNNPIFISFLSASLLSCSYFLKIQFVYMAPILPVSILLFYITDIDNRKYLWKQFLLTSGFMFLFLVTYILFWYLPNKEVFDFVILEQTSDRWITLSDAIGRRSYTFGKYFHNEKMIVFTSLFYLGLAYTFYHLAFAKRKNNKLLFIALLVWLAFEMHKFFISYLPTRYIISLMMLMGAITSLAMYELWETSRTYKRPLVIKIIIALGLTIGVLSNGLNYVKSLNNRSFELQTIKTYIDNSTANSSQVFKIAGPWAPSLSWQKNTYTLPIWKDYFNDINPLENIKPHMIITELDEDDMNQALINQGIIIDDLADSTAFYPITKWDLKLLWLTPKD